MTDDAPHTPDPSAARGFDCAVCGDEAGLVRLFGPPSGGEVVRDSFTSRLTLRLAPEDFERVRLILVAGDAAALHEFDPEVASFYCPDCRACYCGDHWASRNVFDDEDGFTWHDSIRGRCPRGHERMLED